MDASLVYVPALALGYFYSHISTRTFQRVLTTSLDSCGEIKSAPSVAYLNLAEFGGRCRKAMLGAWGSGGGGGICFTHNMHSTSGLKARGRFLCDVGLGMLDSQIFLTPKKSNILL